MKSCALTARLSLHGWAAVAFVVSLLSGCQKWQLDEEARRLCAKDGGISVYETVKRSTSNIDLKAGFALPPLGKQAASDQYAHEWTSQNVTSGNPSLRRDEFRIIRLSDGKELARLVSYSRVGGDMPGPWHESHFRCPVGLDENALMRSVFVD
jgi:hypothetical protein